MSMKADIVEAEDRWLLPVTGMAVDQCCFDFAVVLRLGSGESMWEIRISEPFVIKAGDGTVHDVVPEALSHAEAAIALLRLVVEDAAAHKDGSLVLHLSGGTTVHVPPHARYEAWGAAGPDGMKAFGLPGGDVAVWKSTRNQDG